MSNTASRLITLILLLQNRPNQKAGELANKLDVSLRTIHLSSFLLKRPQLSIWGRAWLAKCGEDFIVMQRRALWQNWRISSQGNSAEKSIGHDNL